MGPYSNIHNIILSILHIYTTRAAQMIFVFFHRFYSLIDLSGSCVTCIFFLLFIFLYLFSLLLKVKKIKTYKNKMYMTHTIWVLLFTQSYFSLYQNPYPCVYFFYIIHIYTYVALIQCYILITYNILVTLISYEINAYRTINQ